jgi:DNA-binding LacI/PurR family transcriptional regulator
LERKISIFEVAKKAGVSKSTVSRALNNDYGVSEKTKNNVLGAVEELKYRPNISARYLRRNTSNLVGILISKDFADQSLVHMVNSRKISGIVKRVSELNYDIVIFIEDLSDLGRLGDIIREKGLAGIILLDRVPVDVLESFRSYSIPFVLVNWYVKGYEHQTFVKTDLAAATTMALDLMTSRGCTEIGVINWEDSITNESIVEDAFTGYMKDKGLSYKGCVWNTVIDTDKEQLFEYIKNSNKRAYLSFSYYSSIKMLDYCRENRIAVPEELAVISYEFFPFFDYLCPKLTGIRQRAEEMGEKAAEKLVSLINRDINVASELIKPEIVIRETCY